MAISLVSKPDNFSPAYNPMMYFFSSNLSLEPNFKYVVDVFINGNKVIRKRILPRPDDRLLEFDVSRLLQNYLTNENIFTNTRNGDSANSYINYSIRVYESFTPSIAIDYVKPPVFNTPILFETTLPHTLNVGDSVKFYQVNIAPKINGFDNVLVISTIVDSLSFEIPFNAALATEIENWQILNPSINLIGSLTTLPEKEIIDTINYLEVSNQVAWNGVEPWSKFTSTDSLLVPATYYDSNTYLLGNSSKLAMSNLPTNGFKIRLDQKLLINFYSNKDINNRWIRMESLDKEGNVIQVRQRPFAAISAALSTVNYESLGGDIGLNSSFVSGTSTTGANFLASPDVKYYRFYKWSDTLGKISKEYTIEIDRDCYFEDEYYIYFLDKLGSMGSFYFNNKSTEKKSISRDTAKTLSGKLKIDRTFGNFWSVEENGTNTVVFSTNEEKSFTLNTSWLSEEQAKYFEDLKTSPVVYIYKTGWDYAKACEITDKSFVRRTTMNDSNIKYTINVNISNNEIINW